MTEQRIADLEAHIERLEKGILTLTAWLTQVPGCLGQHEYEPMRKIVQGDVGPTSGISQDQAEQDGTDAV